MPIIQCPTCGRQMLVNRSVVGDVVGCLTLRCETRFRAIEVRRHSNWLSQIVFYGVIVFAIGMGFVWMQRQGLF